MKRQLKQYGLIALLSFGSAAAVVATGALVVQPPADLGVNIADVPYYKLPYGKDEQGSDRPFWPSRVKTADGKFADPKNIPSAAACVKCHVQEFEEWAASLHAISGRDAVYDKTIDFNEDFKKASTGPEQVRFCEGCHEPAEVILGRTNRVVSTMPSDAETEGLNCVICHTATHADAEKGNGALTISINQATDHLHNALIMASPRDHARAFGAKATNALITKSEFCAACHVEKYDSEVSKSPGSIQVQTTFSEWQKSWYAKNDVSCQDCHMNPDPAGFVEQLKRGVVAKPGRYVHTFVGSNYLMTETALGSNLFFLRGGIIPGMSAKRYLEVIEKQKAETHRLLKSAARLEIRSAQLGAGKKGLVSVAVMNVGAGHNLPTGVSDQKYMWLELDVKDAKDRKLHHSGWFDAKRGEHDPKSVTWMERFWDEQGKQIKDHLTFNTAAIDLTRALVPPRGEDVVDYAIEAPGDVEGPISIQAKLWYRVALQDLVHNVLRADIVVPPFLLTEVSATLPVGEGH